MERNYPQIEKECLAIVFAAERFEQYILGKEKVKVFSDHKPLETILSKPIHTSPKRLQRMRLRLQKYSLDVEYKPGPQMYISDTLSRASLPATETAREDKAIIFEIQELTEKFELEDHHFVSDHRLAQIKEERQTTKSYYDRHAKQLPDLAIGQPIKVKRRPQTPNSAWTPGIVTSKAVPRSYMVLVDGQQYRRNRIHLCQQATFPDRALTETLNIRPRQLDTLPDQTPADPQYTPIQTCTSQTHEIQPHRSSRPVYVPARLKDHDLSKGRRTKPKKWEREGEKKRKDKST